MSRLSDWVTIIINGPVLEVLIVIILIIGVIALGVYFYGRQAKQIELLSSRIQKIDEGFGTGDHLETEKTLPRDAYLQFIYNISHEVSNPLQSIQTNLDNMAKCSIDETGRRQQYCAMITSEVKRLASLTENLRLLARLGGPENHIKRESINLKGVIEDVIMDQIERAENKNIKLVYRGPQRHARVLGNRDHLQQVIFNLVDNCIKYSKDEGGEVIIDLLEEGDKMNIRVIDDGIGISEEDLPFIFDTAYRAPSTSSVRKAGSGLGLAIVKRIVEQHGGEIRVKSSEEKGTTVSFDLPLYNPAHIENR